VICSSTDTHSRIIEEAAAHGKHIFCEKPVDLDLQKIKNALKAVEKAGVTLQVGFNRRFDPNFKKIRDSIVAGKIGTPQIVRITSRDPSPPQIEYVKVSGGIFLDMTIHDFDMARFISGEEVDEVFVHGANLVDPAIEKAGDIDTAVVSMKYKNGSLCTIDNSRKAVYGYDQRLEVFGSKGCLLSENNTPTRTQLWDSTGQSQDLPLFFFLQRYTDSYVAEMQEFVTCVGEGKKPSCSGKDGLIAVEIGLAAKKSYMEKRPVKIQEISGA
jgi:myo-inositol 2-dehydrogenase/D-chiro-inositol 1-dehydrogenase